MSHLADRLPSQVEQGAVRLLDYKTEVVETDGGYEVRNARWINPLRTFEISFPTSTRDDATYQAVISLYEKAKGGLHSFNFKDWTDESGATFIAVRFDTALSITGIDHRLDKIEHMTLKEVRL